MQKNSICIAAVIFSITAAFIFYIPAKYRQHASSKLRITATTSIIADAVKHIAGNHVVINTLMGPGIDPHSYHARLSDIRALLQADLVLYNGLHLEGKMATILHKMCTLKPTFAVADAIDKDYLIESDEFDGIYDPHVWFDVKLWMQVIEYITTLLIEHDKAHASIYQKNRQQHLAQLQKLDLHIAERIQAIAQHKRILVTTHDAFSYFGRSYDMEVVALQGINLDAEPCIIDMQQLVNIICSHNIPTIFVESSLPHRSMQAMCNAAKAQGHNVHIGDELYSDALGPSDSNASTYIDMCKHNVNAVVKGLKSL